ATTREHLIANPPLDFEQRMRPTTRRTLESSMRHRLTVTRDPRPRQLPTVTSHAVPTGECQSDPPSLLRTLRCSRPRGQPTDRATPLDLLLHVRAPNEKQGPADRRRRPLRPPRLKGWGADGEAAGLRRAVGAARAADPASEAPVPLSGSQAARRSQGVDGDPVRVADGDPVGVPAQGDGLRFGDDLLAQVARVAGGGRLAAAARAAAREAERGRSDRLVAGGDRQLACAGVWGGAKTGPSPVDRSRSGSKHHLIACGRGTPLAVSLTGG